MFGELCMELMNCFFTFGLCSLSLKRAHNTSGCAHYCLSWTFESQCIFIIYLYSISYYTVQWYLVLHMQSIYSVIIYCRNYRGGRYHFFTILIFILSFKNCSHLKPAIFTFQALCTLVIFVAACRGIRCFFPASKLPSMVAYVSMYTQVLVAFSGKGFQRKKKKKKSVTVSRSNSVLAEKND